MKPLSKLLDLIIFLTAIVFAAIGGALIKDGGYLLGFATLIASSFVAWLFREPMFGVCDD